MKLTFENVNFVDDGGLLAAELVMTGADIVGLADTGRLVIGNARPDHDIVTLKSGKTRYRKTAVRLKNWTSDLLANEAVIGNLTFNLNPDTTVVDIDEDNHRLVVKDGNFDQNVDSATRTRAIIAAAKNPLQTFDLDTRFAVRVWFATKEEEDKLFHIYNQVGEKVNDTVAKYQYQSTAHQRIAKQLMMTSPHLGMDNTEVQSNTVSANSNKLMAFNTLSQAVEGFWSNDPIDETEEKADAQYLVDFWDELVAARPEFGKLPKEKRGALRGTSVAGTAVSIHGVIALADAMRKANKPLSELSKLKSTVAVPGPGHTTVDVDFFDYDNPTWIDRGILVLSKNKAGETRKTLRMSFQTRKAAGDALIELLAM
ncbi:MULTISPECIES: DNA sulfur modification protein DndB [unclassified Nocardioides]|uniref:DNA sulfur modification protein DndB n=1 Tax=unclassified Nocardioides TaxID=2615069 RepID=UPI001885B794|nr:MULTISPECIES: DNA sulfur modification protein DndB [unclassified Nocardioides]